MLNLFGKVSKFSRIVSKLVGKNKQLFSCPNKNFSETLVDELTTHAGATQHNKSRTYSKGEGRFFVVTSFFNSA